MARAVAAFESVALAEGSADEGPVELEAESDDVCVPLDVTLPELVAVGAEAVSLADEAIAAHSVACSWSAASISASVQFSCMQDAASFWKPEDVHMHCRSVTDEQPLVDAASDEHCRMHAEIPAVLEAAALEAVEVELCARAAVARAKSASTFFILVNA